MSRIDNQAVNWTGVSNKTNKIDVIEKLPSGEYEAHLYKIEKDQQTSLEEVKALYHTNPCNELYNIMNLLEQMEREFKKLK